VNRTPIIGAVSGEDWRVEVELNDDEHGYSLGERLRALDLDDEARERLGEGAIVTRDGSKLFVYTATGEDAEAAAAVVRELLDDERLTAEIRTTRWHPVEEAWQDASEPLPRTAEDRDRELEERDERERREVAAGEGYDWRVHVRAPDRAAAARLEERLREDDLRVDRRWRYLTIGALTEEHAAELASRVQDELPGAEVEMDPTMDAPSPGFVVVRRLL
jgi:hypothetical protein